MKVARTHSANRLVLQSLRKYDRSAPAFLSFVEIDDLEDAYVRSGSHPDIVSRVWDELGSSLPKECRCLLYGTPALIHDRSGIVLAVCYGTAYAIRIPAQFMAAALKAGCTPTHKWSDDHPKTDLQSEFGPDWVFGAFAGGERMWFHASYDQFRINPDG